MADPTGDNPHPSDPVAEASDGGEIGAFLTPTGPRVNMLLCDAAQANGGRLYMLGGGLSVIGAAPQPLAIALHITVPWDRANIPHEWQISLTDEDGQVVNAGGKPIRIKGRFEAGRPAGLRPGTPLGVSLAINIPPLPLPAGRSYTFTLEIDGATAPDWRVGFHKQPPKQQPRPPA